MSGHVCSHDLVRVALLGAVMAVTACSQPEARTEVVVDPAPDAGVAQPTAVTVTQLAQLPDTHPDLDSLKIPSRSTRRMSLDQLLRSIDVVGGLAPGTAQMDPNLALTLGKPDYLQVKEESLEPSPLFMKFMNDLGAAVCTGLGDADPNRPAGERVLTRFADHDQNLRFLLLRFTSIEGPAADPYVERLDAVYQRASVSTARPLAGWEAVCIALFTSPEFLIY